MKMKTTFLFFLISSLSFAQQIGDGFAVGLTANDLNQPLKSGVYEINSLGITPDESYSWQHFFVMRHSNQNNNFQLQFTSSFNENDRFFFRKIANSSTSEWKELATRGANTYTGNQIINGNVGIGTTNPQSILDITGYLTTFGGPNSINSFFGWGVGNGSWDSRPNDTNGKPFIIQHHTGLTLNAHSYYGGIRFYNQGYPSLYDSGLVMSIVNGKVGIGISDPANKLDVNGTIHSKEVKVDLSGWSDFVFKKEYDLPTLAEVERHITEKGHLENIPSETEVLKNGINLGEMNAKLLQKIEELTLYVIEQNKTIEELKKEVKNIKSKI